MNKEAILKSAEIMERVAESEFSQSTWVFQNHKSEEVVWSPYNSLSYRSGAITQYGLTGCYEVMESTRPKEGFCETVACWLGHCALSGEFDGLKVVRHPTSFGSIRYSHHIVFENSVKHWDSHAAAALFEIDYDVAVHLTDGAADVYYGFYHWCNNLPEFEKASPAHVAIALRKLVETDGSIVDDYESESWLDKELVNKRIPADG